MHVFQFSSVPPPLGGNTVHVLRLHEFLTETADVVSRVIDPRAHTESKGRGVITLHRNPIRKTFQLLCLAGSMPRQSIVHFHLSGFGQFKWIAPFLLCLFIRQKKVSTLHSGSFESETSRPIIRPLVAFILKRMHHVITVNPLQAEYLRRLGIPENRITTIPAFIPQMPDDDKLPVELRDLSEAASVVLTSGYLTRLYNYDVLIDCIHALSNEGKPGKQTLFVFAFYNETDESYEKEILSRLAGHANARIVRDLPPAAFVALMRRADIYVRTTTTDGDAVAIREALEAGLTVLATDCVPRPSECRLFGTNDDDTLRGLLLESVTTHGAATTPESLKSNNENACRVLSVYQSLG